MTKRPTIKDVAKQASVSIATVSFVLNNHPGEVISEKVKKRVWAAARQLDYHPSAAAAGLARKHTRNVAILFYLDDSTVSNQFYSFVIQGAIKEAMLREHHLLFSFLDKPYKTAADLPKVIRERNAEGVMFIQHTHAKLVRDIQQRGLPVVAVDHYPPVKDVDSLQIDNRRGGEMAAEHLLDLGHTRLAMVQAAADRPSIAERAQGFRAALEARGIAFAPRTHLIDCAHITFESAYERVLGLLRQNRELTALFCANDEMAAGAIRAAHEAGLDVPGDLSVIGFDDIIMSSYTDPPLTTVGVDKEQLGRRAMARLLDLVEGKDGKCRRETVPVGIVLRKSTGKVRARRKASA
jgi:LacI family transcriptional regulator